MSKGGFIPGYEDKVRRVIRSLPDPSGLVNPAGRGESQCHNVNTTRDAPSGIP